MARLDPNNSSLFWTDRRISGLSLMRADFTTHSFAPHVHEAFVIAVTEEGGAEIKSRGQIEQAHAAKLFVFNPGEPHAGWMGASHRWRYRSFYVPCPTIAEVADALGIDRTPYFLRNDFDDPDLIGAFLHLHRILENPGDPMLERSILIEAFGTLFDRYGSGGERPAAPPRDQELFKIIREAMLARYATSLTLDELARLADLTVFQLIGMFNRVAGMTPHAYLTQVRLDAACNLLERGACIAEAALAAGFYDQSALTRRFKRSYGITPLQFAKATA